MTTASDATTDAEADARVRDNLALVGHVLQQVAARFPRHVDRDELWAAGAMGLVEAAQRFDDAQGVSFATFAIIRIRGAMLDSTRSRDWATRGVRRGARAIAAVLEEARQRGEDEPSDADVAARLGVATADVTAMRQAAVRASLLHLDMRVSSADGAVLTLGETVEELETAVLPGESLERRELEGALREAVQHLPERERDILLRIYVDGEEIASIGASHGVTGARVSQLHRQAVESLRAYLGERYDGVPSVPAAAPGARARRAYVAAMGDTTTFRSRLDAPPLEERWRAG